MQRIKEIRIKNFKAFQQEEVFEFGQKGKNVLVYGNNGSGKSSFFWALYTLLQSSTKTDLEVQKYFEKYLESNRSTHQTLNNVFMDDTEDSFIKITSVDTETGIEVIYTISHDTTNTNKDSDTNIRELNLASDFINYKFLQNFYQAPHKQEVNLWPVFEKDIFPFLTEGTQNWLNDIIKQETLDVPRTSIGNPVTRGPKTRYEDGLSLLNEKIESLLSEIQTNANTFIKDHFFKGRDVIRIELKFTSRFTFSKVKQKMWRDDRVYYRHEQLKIGLSVEVMKDDTWTSIRRVQSFLNEAMLTRIAIGIRIGALRTRPLAEARFKILVLDDMLISLDLSNRMDVVRIILNKENKPELEYFDNYQKFILTHDKGFFDLIRRNTNEEEWEYFKFNKNESDNSPPQKKVELTELQKAVRDFEEHEYESAGNRLRKEAEGILTQYIDPEMKKFNKEFESLTTKLDRAFTTLTNQRLQNFKTTFISEIELEKLKKLKSEYSTDPALNAAERLQLDNIKTRLFDFLIEFNEKKNQKELLIRDVKEINDRIMNASSHHGENPLYRAELQEAINKIKELKEHLNYV